MSAAILLRAASTSDTHANSIDGQLLFTLSVWNRPFRPSPISATYSRRLLIGSLSCALVGAKRHSLIPDRTKHTRVEFVGTHPDLGKLSLQYVLGQILLTLASVGDVGDLVTVPEHDEAVGNVANL